MDSVPRKERNMIKALPFTVYSPAGLVLSGLIQPGGETTYTSLGIAPDMGLSIKTPVLLAVFNLNDSLIGQKGLCSETRALFSDPSPVKEFRFCRSYAKETPDRRTRNKGELFLAGRPAKLGEVFANLTKAAADNGGFTPVDTVLFLAGYAVFNYQGDVICCACDARAEEKFPEQEPAAFRSALRTLKP
jgi:hypothetical protein